MFQVQIQWQLLVCGLDRADFASFNPGERFTPESFPTLAAWRNRPARHSKVSLLHWWTLVPRAARPPMPAEWLAVVEVKPDAERQAWILEEAGRFWFEVEEARATLPPKPEEQPAAKDWSKIEAEFA